MKFKVIKLNFPDDKKKKPEINDKQFEVLF